MSEVWQRRDDVLTRRSLDSVLLSTAKRPEAFALTGSGQSLWSLLAEPVTTEELVQHLATAHQGDPSQIRRDIKPILVMLFESGAIDQHHRGDG